MSGRVPLVVGNWKLHHGIRGSVDLANAIETGLVAMQVPAAGGCEVAIAPVFTALHAVEAELAAHRPRRVALAAQNLWHEDQGAFTGEVSAPLLHDVGCRMVIVGHSERRQLLQESDRMVAAKAEAALRHGLTPIICVGETLDQRRADQTLSVVLGQLRAVVEALPAAAVSSLVFAYEPIWAIGTGLAATPEDAQAVHAAMRAELLQRFGARANTLRILYGGSVKADNAQSLMAQPEVDGALVGGASLVAESFLAIVRAASG